MYRRIRDLMKDATFAELPPTATVQTAAQMMKDFRRCAVLITSDGRLDGILTEQDIVRRVVAERRDPTSTMLSQVMTPHPDTIASDEPALKGLQMMEDGKYRHLVVTSGKRIIGLISRVDFLGEEKTELESERRYWERIG